MPIKISPSDSSLQSRGFESLSEVEDEDSSYVTDDESDENEEEAEEPEDNLINHQSKSLSNGSDFPYVQMTGYNKKTSTLLFNPTLVVNKLMVSQSKITYADKYHMSFKMLTECRLVRNILTSHGLKEAHPNSCEYNFMWMGSHLKPYTLRGLADYQKVNHFPRSYEVTRKDRLFKNVQKMQQVKGFKNFDFVPVSFVMPGEYQEFCSHYVKDKGPYIVKPVASSRGRGIFLINHPEQIPLDENTIVSKYIDNPLLIDGFKFDVRLYVGVTSFDPLIIYLYEEGLTRFATVKFDKNPKLIRNQCMHLTNYSVNKKNSDYVKNEEADIEDYGNKWSLGALLRYLRSTGLNTTALMMRVEDVIIKTLLSVELPIASASKMFMPHRGNCFELFGFDVLIDSNLRPWVLEVNLSPSLNTDAPLDLKIKGNMVSDLFSLTGFICHDPLVRKTDQNRRVKEIFGKLGRSQSAYSRPNSALLYRKYALEKYLNINRSKRQRPSSAVSVNGVKKTEGRNLTSEEIRVLRRAKEEHQRRGGWVRIFPTVDSWELYGSFFQSASTYNLLLWQHLFPDRASNISSLKCTTASYSSSISRAKSIHLHSTHTNILSSSSQGDTLLHNAALRVKQYERKLASHNEKSKTDSSEPAITFNSSPPGAPHIDGVFKGTLVQGVVQKSTSTAVKSIPPSPAKEQPTVRPHRTVTPVINNLNTRPPHHKEVSSLPSSLPSNADTKRDVKFNVVQQLEDGKSMTKVQARFAFASYLKRVQQRLNNEKISSTDTEEIESANEQMDLVLRFLRRAAANLQQSFRVAVPSRKLSLNSRRNILAKQLSDFIHIYQKETELLQQIKETKQTLKTQMLNDEKFTKFVNLASEQELEEVLTTYTRINKSASIFLGSSSQPAVESKPTPTNERQDCDEESLSCNPEDSGKPCSNSSKSDHLAVPEHTISLTTAPPTFSSHSNAVAVYSAKLGSHYLRQRPLSASNIASKGDTSSNRTRPLSATNSRVMVVRPSSTTQASIVKRNLEKKKKVKLPDDYDEAEINSALHRLALRQKQRQYLANKRKNSMENLSAVPTQHFQGLAVSQNHQSKQKTFDNVNKLHKLAFGNATDFDKLTFGDHREHQESTHSIHNSDDDWRSSTGILSGHNYHIPYNQDEQKSDKGEQAVVRSEQKSKRLSDPSMSLMLSNGDTLQALKQRRMLETSKLLLEQSRAKHQAMVAQAHATQASRQDTTLVDKAKPVIYTPKPPPKPASIKKPTASHRAVRLTNDLDSDR